MKRTAVVLLNLGAPDEPSAVRPFLQSLFADPYIIEAPGFVRWFLSRVIARTRAREAGPIYDQLGGRSPLLPNTEAQAAALEAALNSAAPSGPFKCFVAMRHWKPWTADAIAAIQDWGAEQIVLVPLYPQFSRSTTGSSFYKWRLEAAKLGLELPTFSLCCYPLASGFVEASAALIQETMAQHQGERPLRLLFSAHGIPLSMAKKGDPYPEQIARCATAIAQRLDLDAESWRICYQSKVGPLPWLTPSTETELHQAGADGVDVAVYPLAFVSEHSETLIELDVEYAEIAEEAGIEAYLRVPTVGVHTAFIDELAQRVRQRLEAPLGVLDAGAGRFCAQGFARCPSDAVPPNRAAA